MKKQTPIANTIDVTDYMIQYDSACKKLLAHKIILAWLLKSVVSEFHAISIHEITNVCIEGIPSISQIPVNGDEPNPMILGMSSEASAYQEGTTVFDIRFHACCPRQNGWIKLFINVEGQKDYYPGYAIQKRGIFYCSRMISSQYQTEFTKSDYDKLCKVYSIWICMNPSKQDRNTITRYYIDKENMAGKKQDDPDTYDLLCMIMICLNTREPYSGTGILKLLNILFSPVILAAEKKKILESEFHIMMTKQLEEDIKHMCNFSEFVFEEGYNSGFEKGTIDGMKQGIEQGIEQGENRFSQLILFLLANKRYEDLEKVSQNADYRKQLYQQYNM